MTAAERFLPPLLDFMAQAGARAMAIQSTAQQTLKSEDVAVAGTNPAFRGSFTAIVTEADTAISAMFADWIQSLPDAADHYVIDEEVCGTVTAAHGAIEKARYVWVIDPIDGTAPYAHGLPMWGTMVALFENGRPVLGAIALPALGELVYSDGQQAFRFNAHTGTAAALSPLAPQPLHPSAIVFGPTWMADFDPEPVLMMDVHAAAAYAAYTVLGKCRASFFGQPMKIWDVAAAMAIAPHVGLKLLNIRTGVTLETLDLDALLDNWKLRDIHVLCHPSQFDELRKLPRGRPA